MTTESTAIVVGPQARFQKISDVLYAKKDAIGALLPKHLTAERLLRVALSACSRNMDLLNCTPQSLVLSLAIAAYLGIEPNMPNGRGYLIPRKNKNLKDAQEATFLLGYKGIIYLATNSGKIASIESQVVYEKEDFRFVLGTESRIEHDRSVFGNRGKPIAYYAVARMKNGVPPLFEVMTVEEVEEIRKRSPAGNDGPWVTDPLQMGRKTVIRRLGNYLVLDDEKFETAIRADNAADGEASPDFSEMLEGQHEGAAKALTIGEGGDAPALSQGSHGSHTPADRGEALAAQLGAKKPS